MTTSKKALGVFSGDQRTSICMSKLGRTLQSSAAKANWNEMVKMLFWADPHQGRPGEIRKLVPFADSSQVVDGASYNPDQFQYILMLMLIISTAEKRTEELYGRLFSERCDAISKEHELQDDQYWTAEKVPAEWVDLNAEFEQRSRQILLATLREYHQDEIADMVESDGPDQLFSIIQKVKSQFLNLLENVTPGAETETYSRKGSIPETLQPTARKTRSRSQKVK